MQNTANMSGASGANFGEKEDFKLEEKVTAESEGIRMLRNEFLIQLIITYRIGLSPVIC